MKARLISKKNSSLGYHLLLSFVALVISIPFIWMFLTSLKSFDELGSANWVPETFQWDNYKRLFSSEGLWMAKWFWNSIFVASSVTLIQVLTSALAAYAFSRMEWPFRDQIFFLYLATMMIPNLIVTIPNYYTMVELGLINSYAGLILPASFISFGTFLLRQFMLAIPKVYDETAIMDGATKMQLFWKVIFPLAKPGILTLAIFSFVNSYQNLFWPLLIARSKHMQTLPVGLGNFEEFYGDETNLLLSAIVIAILPMAILFIIMQKQLVKGFYAETGAND